MNIKTQDLYNYLLNRYGYIETPYRYCLQKIAQCDARSTGSVEPLGKNNAQGFTRGSAEFNWTTENKLSPYTKEYEEGVHAFRLAWKRAWGAYMLVSTNPNNPVVYVGKRPS